MNSLPVISDHPDMKTIDAERQQLAELRADHTRRMAAAKADYDEQVAARKQAAAAGDDVGPEPEVPGIVATARTFHETHQNRQDKLRWAERDVVAANADEFLTQLAALEAELLGQATEHVEALRDLADDVAHVVAAVRHVRTIIGDPTQTVSGRVTAASLVEAIDAGYSLLNSDGQRRVQAGKIIFSERTTAA